MTQAKSAIVGLGISEMGKVYGRSGNELALEAISRALDDAGIKKEEVDGLLTQSGVSNAIGLPLQNAGGFKNLRLVNHMNAMGATPAGMVQYATWAIQNGVANTVVGVFCDTPMAAPGQGAGASMSANRMRGGGPVGFQSLDLYYSPMNPNASYAMAARRHMHQLRHHQRAVRRHRRGRARLGRPEPHGRLPCTDHSRRPPELSLDRGALPPAGLLHGVEWRRRDRRHFGRTGQERQVGAGLRAGDGSGLPGQLAARR